MPAHTAPEVAVSTNTAPEVAVSTNTAPDAAMPAHSAPEAVEPTDMFPEGAELASGLFGVMEPTDVSSGVVVNASGPLEAVGAH